MKKRKIISYYRLGAAGYQWRASPGGASHRGSFPGQRAESPGHSLDSWRPEPSATEPRINNNPRLPLRETRSALDAATPDARRGAGAADLVAADIAAGPGAPAGRARRAVYLRAEQEERTGGRGRKREGDESQGGCERELSHDGVSHAESRRAAGSRPRQKELRPLSCLVRCARTHRPSPRLTSPGFAQPLVTDCVECAPILVSRRGFRRRTGAELVRARPG